MKFATPCALALLVSSAMAQHDAVRRLDFTPSGAPSEGWVYEPIVTPDAEYIVFTGTAVDLTATPPALHVPSWPVGVERFLYRCDVRNLQFVQVNVGSPGHALPPADSSLVFDDRVAMSADGNLVVWTSAADDAGLGDTNGELDVFLRDVQAGTTTLISSGTAVDGPALGASISDDGRYVTYISASDHEVPGLGGGSSVGAWETRRLFLLDRQTGTRTLLSAFNGGYDMDEGVYDGVVSPDGTKVVYGSVPGPLKFGFSSPLDANITVYDIATGTRQTFGGYSSARRIAVSEDASRIAFTTFTKVDPNDSNNREDYYVLEPATGKHLVGSTTTNGSYSPLGNISSGALSRDGRYLMFDHDTATVFTLGKEAGSKQQVVKDLETGLTTLATINEKGAPGVSVSNLDKIFPGVGQSLNHNGDVLVFASNYDSLPGNNVEADSNLYIHERRFGARNLWISNLVAGGTAQLQVSGMTPNGAAMVGFSFTGQGPFPSYWGPVDLSQPLFVLYATADASGTVALAQPVAPSLVGWPVWAKAIDLVASKPSTTFYDVIR